MRNAVRPALTALAVAAASLCLVGAAGAAEPKMRIDPRLRVSTVCFPVTDPLGLPRTLYGKRYTTPTATSSTPAIVLVHGIASSTANWDFSPSWSTARALATAGYVVYSYDRLGYARSSYFDVPGGGETLTTREHRRMLHEVVQDVKTGGYATSASDDCAAATPGGTRNPTVAILGHSAGGWIVAGYPGTYHDVAAMIQTSIFATTDGAAAASDQSSQGGGFDPNPNHPDYFDFFHQRSDCESFNVYPPGAVQSVVDIACTPPFIPSPYGEITDLRPSSPRTTSRSRRSARAHRCCSPPATTTPRRRPKRFARTSSTTRPTAAATCRRTRSRAPATSTRYTHRCSRPSTSSCSG